MERIFFDEYAAASDITLRDDDYRTFTNLTLKTRDRNIRKYLKNKIFRECTAFSRKRSFNQLVMLSRHYDSPGIQQLISAPGDFLHSKSAKTLKLGNTATLASVHIDGRDIVIKHYRVKGTLHGLRKACLRSRAESSWINAHRLQRYGIYTAPPVALIMNTIGPFRLDSYFITEHVPGPNAADFFNSPAVSVTDKMILADKLFILLKRLAANRLHHGDLKATNFIISGIEPALLDLDSMQQYRSHTSRFRRAFKKDLQRFKRNWDSGSEIGALLHELTDKVAREFL
jgi:tRNA A-37 threonylcarbamoyl transferase component Bud32